MPSLVITNLSQFQGVSIWGAKDSLIRHPRGLYRTVAPFLISFLGVIWHSRGCSTTIAFSISTAQANLIRMGKKTHHLYILQGLSLNLVHNTGGNGMTLEFQIN